MPQRTLRFKIRQDGLVEESVEGIAGNSCFQLTEKIESALGNVQHTELKSEAYIASSETQTELVPEHINVI